MPAAVRTRPEAAASGVAGAASVLVLLHCTTSAGAGVSSTLGAEGAVCIVHTPRSKWRVEAFPAGGDGGDDSHTGRTRSNTGLCAAAACCTWLEIWNVK